MTEQAFNDQCTGANPRYPLMSELKEIYREGFRTWRYSLMPEFNPGYDFLYFLSDPDNAKPDEERIKTWFYRFGATRIASGVSLTNRIDYPQKLFILVSLFIEHSFNLDRKTVKVNKACRILLVVNLILIKGCNFGVIERVR